MTKSHPASRPYYGHKQPEKFFNKPNIVDKPIIKTPLPPLPKPAFPEKVLLESQKIAEKARQNWEQEIRQRRDFRNVTTLTIDPPRAQDFDDAISIREIPGNLIEIGIHIADVSHYLRPGTDLDTEAARRGNSIYLVDRTIPMLPEVLSNDLCSLNPNEDKLTFAAIFTFKKDVLEKGPPTVESQWFGKTIINSDKRFSYEEAQGVLDDGKGIFYDELLILNNLAKKLRKKREENGALSFEHEEVRFLLDATGKPLRVYKKIMQDTNKLVEEFMLLANKKVARRVH